MVDKLMERIIDAGTFRTIYQALCSILALAVVASAFGLATPEPDDPDAGDGQLAAMGASPLAAIYRALGFLSIPRGFVLTVSDYLAENSTRAEALSFVAVALAILLTFLLSPTIGVPSLQASTWWLCAAVAKQCGGGGFWLVVIWLLVYVVGKAIKSRDMDDLGLDVAQVLSALFLLPALPLLTVLFDRTQPRDQ